jgi:crotonobetainyl-CoA:carnitine CoA-transferase CaiB-like acyl-CoA transferase
LTIAQRESQLSCVRHRCPLKLEDSGAEVQSAPRLGQPNSAIHDEYLGLGETELEELKRQGVI